MATEVLKLSTTEFDRPVVVIDGKRHAMRSPEEFTRQMSVDFDATLEAIRSAGTPPERMDAVEVALGMVMVALPKTIVDKLSPNRQWQIVQAFLGQVSAGVQAEIEESLKLAAAMESTRKAAEETATGAEPQRSRKTKSGSRSKSAGSKTSSRSRKRSASTGASSPSG